MLNRVITIGFGESARSGLSSRPSVPGRLAIGVHCAGGGLFRRHTHPPRCGRTYMNVDAHVAVTVPADHPASLSGLAAHCLRVTHADRAISLVPGRQLPLVGSYAGNDDACTTRAQTDRRFNSANQRVGSRPVLLDFASRNCASILHEGAVMNRDHGLALCTFLRVISSTLSPLDYVTT